MIIWGGLRGSPNSGLVLNTGGRYDPVTDSWTPTTTTAAPSARADHTAVWTGNVMIVWGGGQPGLSGTNTGSRYNPIANTWAATPAIGAPAARGGSNIDGVTHTAVWTGSVMIVRRATVRRPYQLGKPLRSANTWAADSHRCPSGAVPPLGGMGRRRDDRVGRHDRY
jgi:hypothetical protein